jgi:CRP/FNR family transcriptional regulator
MHDCVCQNEDCVLCAAHLNFGLSSDQVCDIRGMLSMREYGPREILFRESEPGTQLFLLRRGQVKLTALGTDGREQIIDLAVSGRLLGFHSVNDPAYAYTAETLTPTTVCKIRHTDMLKVLAQNPEVSLRVIDILNRELTAAHTLIRMLGQKTAMEKVATFILSLVPADQIAPAELLLPMSRQEIAELLGLTIETVSRLISELRREAVIDTPRGHIRIQNLARLRSLAGAPPTMPRQKGLNLAIQ